MNFANAKIIFLHWVYALLKSVVQGCAISLKAFFGAAAGNAATEGAVPALNLKQASVILACAAVYHAVDFLAKNPLPDADDQPATTTTPTK